MSDQGWEAVAVIVAMLLAMIASLAWHGCRGGWKNEQIPIRGSTSHIIFYMFICIDMAYE
jgi:hypothetical protein